MAGDALKPDNVSKTTTANPTVQVQNTGGATVVLPPGDDDDQVCVQPVQRGAESDGPDDVAAPARPRQPGTWRPPSSGAIASNTYFPVVALNGTGKWQQLLHIDHIDRRRDRTETAAIAISGHVAVALDFYVDQTKPIKVRMVVSNTGGAGATFTAASMRFIHAGQDRTPVFISMFLTFRNGSLLSPGEVAPSIVMLPGASVEFPVLSGRH